MLLLKRIRILDAMDYINIYLTASDFHNLLVLQYEDIIFTIHPLFLNLHNVIRNFLWNWALLLCPYRFVAIDFLVVYKV